jgi:short-subunit dehydrogenase
MVTGASSGIGRQVALDAAAGGDHLVLIARDETSLREVATECGSAGASSTMVLPADVGQDDQVEAAFDAAVDRHGRIDAVTNLAGVFADGRTDQMPQEVFDGVVRTNLTGSVNVARHALHVMRPQRHGALVLVGSVLGHTAVPGMTPYVVSKWGVRALARQLQLENRDLADVSISYVAPGPVSTPIWDQGADYTGWSTHPPPPADSPEKVARTILELVDRPRKRVQVGLVNGLVRFAFTAVPGVHDAVVGPLVRLVATDFTRPRPPDPGNVLSSRPALHGVHGTQAGPVRRLARSVVGSLRSRQEPG